MRLACPVAGLEWSRDINDELESALRRQEVVELIPENFFADRHSPFLKKLANSQVPTIIHGVDLSLGSAEAFRQSHFDACRRIADQVPTIIFSEHLAMTHVGGVELGQLCPIQYNDELCDIVCRKIDHVQKALNGMPFMLENIANRFIFPGSTMSETHFINRILARTGCYLLLDINNIYVNSRNFSFDPYQWVDAIRLDRVLGIHLAGGFKDEDDVWQDGHSHPVPQAVWDLYAYACSRSKPMATIVERTAQVPSLTILEKEVNRARHLAHTTIKGESHVNRRPADRAVLAASPSL